MSRYVIWWPFHFYLHSEFLQLRTLLLQLIQDVSFIFLWLTLVFLSWKLASQELGISWHISGGHNQAIRLLWRRCRQWIHRKWKSGQFTSLMQLAPNLLWKSVSFRLHISLSKRRMLPLGIEPAIEAQCKKLRDSCQILWELISLLDWTYIQKCISEEIFESNR